MIPMLMPLIVWRNFTVDDAFISWRHGLNLVQGHGYSFAIGDAKLESATSPIYGILSAIPALVGLDVVLFFKIIGICNIIFIYRLAVRNIDSKAAHMLFLLLALGGPVQAIHIWSGLETGILVTSVLVLMLATIGKLEISNIGISILMSLVCLIRLEFIVTVLTCAFLLSRDNPKGFNIDWLVEKRFYKKFLSYLWPTFVSVIILTTFRIIYFSEYLPNTFFAKSSINQKDLESTLRLVFDNFSIALPFVAACAISILICNPKFRFGLSILFLGQAIVYASYLSSNLSMNFASRFPYQVFWPVVLTGIATINQFSLNKLFSSIVIWTMPLTFSPDVVPLVWYYPQLQNAQGELGRTLHEARKVAKIQNPTLVIGDAGLAPYLSEWEIDDPLLLGSPAKLGREAILRNISTRSDVVLALYSGGDSGPVSGSDSDLLLTGLAADFKRVGSFCMKNDYCFQVYLSPDLFDNTKFVETLKHGQLLSNQLQLSLVPFRDAITKNYWHS
jgi:hypothetical protein